MTNQLIVEVAESGDGKLYEVDGFQIPVLAGSHREMGAQYGGPVPGSSLSGIPILLELEDKRKTR